MPSNLTRRRFIAASLVAPAALPVNDALAIDDPERLRLIQRREYLQSEIAKLDRQWTLAYAKLPSWCRPGSKYRSQDGYMFGGVVGWPDAGFDAIKLASGDLLVRPSARDIFELRQSDRSSMAFAESERLFARRLKALIGRLREQRRVENAVKLPRSSAWLPLEIKLEGVEAAISLLLTGEHSVYERGARL
ncbi:hypothetical protein [Afipia clevelandensis]|uniref:Tat (Twin-arginine translocation) pathway signal sequence n=1 Tax=Afipia clevelandensis ATCC 49720 TaxID=883079 RepID=K8NQJ9_9BRAD|nr:hypothetical protein [Afipia clevelandensis]EKS32652.1 hypothetical protein HMPREF9696_03629 [Afipia clevelandensis ATCC 49720]